MNDAAGHGIEHPPGCRLKTVSVTSDRTIRKPKHCRPLWRTIAETGFR